MSEATRRTWPATLKVEPIRHASGVVQLPGSKSLTNRALLLAAFSEGTTALSNVLDAEDTQVMIGALRALGVTVTSDGSGARIEGCGGVFPRRTTELFLGNAGTAMRSLAAALAFAGGTYRLDGVARMRERPIGDLVDALNALGARVRYAGAVGYPPLLIEPAPLAGSSEVDIRGGVSSQFVSGLLMAAPLIAPPGGLRVNVPGTLISQPYVAMTIALMQRFGIEVARVDAAGGCAFNVPRSSYRSPGQYAIEGDASSASYFLALGALAGGPIKVQGAGLESVQGDVAFAHLLEAMGARVRWGSDWIETSSTGALRGVDYDCGAIPDAAMTAGVVALFAQGRTRLRGIGSWRVKETDRIAAMATELGKLGAQVETGPDWLAVEGPVTVRTAEIETYDDHRVAMCFALAATGGVPVVIRDPRCVSKTFPTFFDVLASVSAT
ncbi:MAG TPA: 3-phosphoshikimate 1-carboxyvinyltransferase [Burkholderiaceae bacterium]|nr:3-phosphoshikimate 1-carboxyvinyltransferase [Burkholderiaceae bacterium]